LLGAEFYHDFIIRQENYDVNPYYQYIKKNTPTQLLGLFGQVDLTILTNLILTAGGRFDFCIPKSHYFSPRLALIYHPFQSTTCKIIYGQSFRPPNAYELYYSDGTTQFSDPDLKPEKIQTFELIWEQQLAKTWRLKTSGYFYRISDPIWQKLKANGLVYFDNAGIIDAKGLEMELAGKWLKHLEGRLSYTFQDARDAQTGRLLPNLPKHLVKTNLIFPVFKDKVFLGVENIYASNRIALSGRKVFGYPITNLTLFTRNIVPKLQVSASVYNLFNQKYCYPGGGEHLTSGIDRLRQDGINFRVKLQYTF
jgi:iron complex outermembrane receptor protein